MTAILAAVVRPFTTLDAWLTDRRLQEARQQHALDMARAEAESHRTPRWA